MPGLSRFKTWLWAAFGFSVAAALLNAGLSFAGVPFFPVRWLIDLATIVLLVGFMIATVTLWRLGRMSWIVLASTGVVLLVLHLLATSEILWPTGHPDRQGGTSLERFVLQPAADIVLTLGAYTLLYFYVVAWEKLTESRAHAAAEQALREAQERTTLSLNQRTDELADANRRLQQEVEERKRIEQDLRAKQRSLEVLVAAHDQERQEVVYQIHDNLMQHLTAASLHVESVAGRQPDLNAEARAQCDRAFQLLRIAMHAARGLLTDVRPPILDEQGLVAGLKYLAAEHERQCGPAVTLTHHVNATRISRVAEGALYRIAQEALRNARRHSKAHKISLDLRDAGDNLRLEIGDDGVGFDTTRGGPQGRGLGAMAELARALLGEMTVESSPGNGTRIVVEIPAADARDREIEQRLAAERALEESQRVYRLLADYSTDVISRHAPDGTTLYISPACKRLFGYEPEDVMARPPIELIHPDDLEQISNYLVNAASAGDFFTFTYRTRAKAGHYRWVETVGRRLADPETGETIEFITNSREITDRREAEEKLRASEERFRTLLDALPVGLYLSEGPAGHLVYANPAALEIWGVKPEEFHAYVWHQAVHPDDREQILADVQRTIAAGKAFGGEFRALTPAGELKYVRVVASFVIDQEGGRSRRVGIVEDITARKLAEQRREEADRRHASLVRAFPDMVFQVGRDGTFIGFEPGQGIEPLVPYEAFRGKRLADVLPPEIAELSQAAVERALDTGRLQTIEYELDDDRGRNRYEARVAPSDQDGVFVFVRHIGRVAQA